MMPKMMKQGKILTEPQALIQQARFLHQAGHLAQAAEQYAKLLKQYPKNPQLLTGLGTLTLQQGNPEQAQILLEKSLKVMPKQEDAQLYRGIALAQLNRLDEAWVCYTRTIKINQHNPRVYNLRGFVSQKLKQFENAIVDYDKAIAFTAEDATIYNNRGNSLQELQRFTEAIASFERAIALNENYPEAYFNLGNVQKELLQLDDALQSFNKAIALNAAFVAAHNNLGLTLFSLGKFSEALLSFDQAITLEPHFAQAYNNRGLTLDRLRQFELARHSFEQALNLKPDYAEAWHNHGDALLHLNYKADAVHSYERAIACKPDYTEAYSSRGLMLDELKQYPAAIASYDQAIAINPDFPFLGGQRLYSKMQICDWQGMEQDVAELIARIERAESAYTAFTVMAVTDSLPIQRKVAETWTANKCPAMSILPALVKYPPHDKLRIAYFSMDFRNHAVALLTAELFEKHDRSRFEIMAFSFGPDTQDEMRVRLESSFDRFVDIRHLSDQQAAQLARDMAIDIAVDLAGHTGDCRTGIFAMRAAPIQLSYIGYLGTMAAEYMDYLLADEVLIPQSARSHYVEKIVYLPSYQVNDRQRRIADTVYTRQQLGLPERSFVFCCFNNNFKITAAVFSSWMRILNRVPGSVLFLYAENDYAEQNLKKAALACGIDAGRLVFGKPLPLPEYLARYRVADLFLDTMPYNGGATASDALWAGLPVLTRTGEAFASRIAASLLTAIDLPELITATVEEYEAVAIDLATHPEKMAAIKYKLAQNRLATPLFDSQGFTQYLEQAYSQMYQRYLDDLPADDIYIQPCTAAAWV
jgi:predicted O-linked N-acetylglucosamine transferase (SPINDLY family)